MNIFKRLLIGFLAVTLVYGSQAASFGVLPAGTRLADAAKGDSVLFHWRTGAVLTISDFGISNALHFPVYNPNAKKYTPFLTIKKNNDAMAVKPGVKSLKTNFTRSAKTLAVTQLAPEPRIMPSLNAFPNPSKGITRISLAPLGDDVYKIKISNAIGKVYKVIPVRKETTTESVTVDLSPLPAGIYFYSLLVNEKMVETKRLILQPQ